MTHGLADLTASLILLTAAYAFGLALLLHLSLRSRWRPLVKLAAVLLGLGLGIAAYEGHKGALGWATPTAMPEAFRLHWVKVREPDKASGASGTIFFWASALDEAGFAVGEPRAYRTPWDLATAQEAEQALAMLKGGELLNGQRTRDAVAVQEGGAETQGGRYGAGAASRQDEEAPQFTFRPVPPPDLPPKAGL